MTKEGIKVLKPAEVYTHTHTHTHTHTQLKRCRDFLCKLCLGAVLIFAPIFSFAITLPSGYTELEYIESTGTQYIDLNFGFDKTDEVRAIFSIDKDTTCDKYIVAPKNWNTNNNRFGLGQHCYYNTYVFAYGSANTRTTSLSPWRNLDGEIHEWLYKNFVASILDLQTSIDVSNVVFGTTSTNLRLFYGYDAPTIGKIQYYKHTKNGFVIFEGVPAKRNSDSAVGMYDTVSDTFFENSGTGSFVAGPAVSSCGYTELEYLELQGEAYFNTNVYLSKDMDIEFEFMPTQLDTAGVLAMNRSVTSGGFLFSYNINNVIGSYTYNNINIDFFGTSSNGDRWVVQRVGSGDEGYVLENNKKYKLSIVNKVGSFYKDGTQLDTYTYTALGESPMTTPLYINASTFSNGQSTSPTYKNGNLHIRFYHFSATGVADIVPVKRDCDNVLGLYNKTTGEFLEKIGSGTLVAGPVVGATVEQGCEYTRLEYLKSSNTQYIQDDSFQTIGTGAIEIKTKDLQTYTRFAGWDGLVALATPNSATNYFPFLYGSWDDYNPNPVSIAAENALRYEFEPGLQKLYVNGVLNRQAQKNTSIYSAPFRMFIVSTGGGYNHGSTIYYCRVYDGNNVLLRNYIPVKRNSDNVLGMYDTVTGTFFTNKGSGTFTAGPELAWGNNCSVTISITWDGVAEPDASGMCVYGETFTAPSTAPTAPSGLKFLGWIPL